MARQSTLRLAESFRHAITYLIREANRAGFVLVGASLKEAHKAVDEELGSRGCQGISATKSSDEDSEMKIEEGKKQWH